MAIRTNELDYLSADGKTKVFARVWSSEEEKPEFIVQIAHGMCEYIDRYDEFARFLAKNGAVVCGNDHLGHGNTKDNNPGSHYGYFAKRDGEKYVVEDMHTLTKLIKERYPNLPFFLLGHSMGSMLSRDYMTKYADEAVGAIFVGTSGTNNLTGLIRFLARVGMVFGRAKREAHFLSYLAFAKYNDEIKDLRTKSDWISRDREIVDHYVKDPRTTFKFTDRAAYDFANLMDKVSGLQWAQRLKKEKPYLLFSGSMDPVGNYTKGVSEVYDYMKQAGIEDVSLKFYEGARHEVLNETNRKEVFHDVLDWIRKKKKEYLHEG